MAPGWWTGSVVAQWCHQEKDLHHQPVWGAVAGCPGWEEVEGDCRYSQLDCWRQLVRFLWWRWSGGNVVWFIYWMRVSGWCHEDDSCKAGQRGMHGMYRWRDVRVSRKEVSNNGKTHHLPRCTPHGIWIWHTSLCLYWRYPMGHAEAWCK